MRDLTAVAKEGSHQWVPIQDLPFDEIILFAIAADHSSRPTYVYLPSGLYHARSGRILQQSGPNQEVMAFTSLMDGEYDPAWTFRQMCLGREIHPSMIPSGQRQPHPLPNHYKHGRRSPRNTCQGNSKQG